MLRSLARYESRRVPDGWEARIRQWVTDPLMPVVLLGLLVAASAAWSSLSAAWITFGAIAGYSLSGST